MAKLVFSNMVSLDGYCAGVDGNLDGLPMTPAFDKHNLELMRSAGTLLFGRITFGMFQAYWPLVRSDPSADPVLAGIAAGIDTMRLVVVSDTLALSGDEPYGDAEVVRRAQSRARIRALKAEARSDLLAFGSHVLMNDLLSHGLIDEVRLLVANVVLRDGVRLFDADLSIPLTPIENRRLPESDVVMLRYACGLRR